jgi:hypothetical protein
MRTRFLITIFVVILLGGCKKSSGPVNFSCYIAGTYLNSNTPTLVNGNASAAYYNSVYPPYLQLTMTGIGNQTVAISWYNIDSVGAIVSQLTPKTYTIPAHTNYPPTVSAVYNAQYGTATYLNGNGAGGTVTITSNTGTTLSGNYSFSVLNQTIPFDTVYVTQGTFTNVPIP